MSDSIEQFCDNFHKLKSKNGIDKRINFDRNETVANFYSGSDISVSNLYLTLHLFNNLKDLCAIYCQNCCILI